MNLWRPFMALLLASSCLGGLIPLAHGAEIPAEFQVKREAVFEFASTPKVTRDGDRITIAFETKGFCDATVAIEDAEGRIVRHLASGVLGANAPAPFAKESKKQTVVWDGKDDQGRYVDNVEALAVRVSLGLDPKTDKDLFRDNYKRFGSGRLLMAACPEGVLVYDVQGSETVRLYDHDGKYARTCYPFPSAKVEQVAGLPWFSFPDGARAPRKRAYFLATLLEGPQSGNVESSIRINSESSALATGGGRVALAGLRLNRLALDGGSGGAGVHGPYLDILPPREFRPNKIPIAAAFSPDAKTLYLSGYMWMQPRGWAPVTDACWAHGVYRMDYEKDDAPALFLGEDTKPAKDDKHFSHPAALCVDAAGRLYVADYMNDRVQVFSPEGKLLGSVPVEGPAKLAVHHKTGELYVFSWFLSPQFGKEFPESRNIKPMLRKFSAFPELKAGKQFPLPLQRYATKVAWSHFIGGNYQAVLDSWAEPPVIWMVDGSSPYPVLFAEGPDGLKKTRDFHAEAKKSGISLDPVALNRQRLYADHQRGYLYVAEGDCGTNKGFSRLQRIQPESGECKTVDLPLSPEDLAIGPDGFFYLRDGSVVARYDGRTWREVPFDYGEETAAGFGDGKRAELIGGLVMPSTLAAPHWHLGGIDVNVRGDLLVACYNPASCKIETRKEEGKTATKAAKAYVPALYPGRSANGYEAHIWDKHGVIKYTDVLPGQTMLACGVGLDADDCVYANVAASVMLDGKPYYTVVGHRYDQVGTLVKARPGAGKFIAAVGGPVPVGKSKPDRPTELAGLWVEGAEWFYPGVGRTQAGMDCSCWNSRFTLDYYARSFAPEYDRYSVAVLDKAGNLILRVGHYGNADDPEGLFDACFVATLTDKRLFVSDPGNGRILNVRLDYHTNERVALKDVRE
ncbi:MAG: SMP-30/gluconolactonase/LRE family protein [Planctomycetes bacterium]|nr:SMP-30/gluconolactonase/LRE family protein [Planctomycetota bacterium]